MRKEEKAIRECYNYYVKNINTDEYKKYVEASNIESDRVLCECEKEYPELEGKIDTYFNGDAYIAEIKILDILSNKGIESIIKRLYALPRKKYTVDNYYKRVSIGKHFDYVHLQLGGKAWGHFAEIKFKNDKYIDEINISWTQLDSFSAALEYTFVFKRSLNDELEREFILSNINNLSSKDYRDYYFLRKKSEDNYFWMLSFENDLLHNICQHYLTSLLYSERGKEEELLSLVVMTRRKPININTLEVGFINETYYNREQNYVITTSAGGGRYYLLSGENRIPSFSISGCIARFGTNFYYAFNSEKEMRFLESSLSRYSTGRKRISKKRLISLLNRLYGMAEIQYSKVNAAYEEISDRWDYYQDNKKMETFPLNEDVSNQYKEIYERSFSYFKTRSEIELENTNKGLAIITACVATISMIIALFALIA